MEIQQIVPYFLSAITIYMFLLAGNKKKHTWLVGLFNQGLWLFWIVLTGTWGLLPMNIALWVVYYRNNAKWKLAKQTVIKESR
jgi:succinate dehydrogenase hydrophobic anchor subunit